MDSQVVEVLGRNRLVDELLRAGLEVAQPVRDRGIDLVAYSDLDSRIGRFVAQPIQLKAASNESFSLDSKYAKFPDLILAYVWHLQSAANMETYALHYPDALGIADTMGWTQTNSWARGRYSDTCPGSRLRQLIEPFRMSSERWRSLVVGSRDIP